MEYIIDTTSLYYFKEGTNSRAYEMFGNHRVHNGEYEAVRFSVYAPNAIEVSVVGSFNEWNIQADKMNEIRDSGVYEVFIGHAKNGDIYKYAIKTKKGNIIYKADPYAVRAQMRPDTASMVWEIENYEWNDQYYMDKRSEKDIYNSAMCIYEVHEGSWKIGEKLFELSSTLVDYVKEMGFTHIELMPISEYPYDDSWGYQVTGYYAVSARYGTPYDLKHFVDECHINGIGVIVDWVAAHFPKDEHGLIEFDGMPLYESNNKLRSEQPEWGTLLFDYGKPEVRSFLISNAVYLLKEYHIDGLRVDAVSCMLYHDYGKKKGNWLPNKYGSKENLEAIDFLRNLSIAVNRECPNSILIAEESTAFPLVTKPPHVGGLGFNFKWNMGFMNDTLQYISLDSYFRSFNHDNLTFSMIYAFSENFILPFSHDEMVHGKKSLIGRMIGTYDDKFAQLRLLFMYQYAHPGKKLMFMGSEIGQFSEWDYKNGIEFFLTDYDRHKQMQEFVKRLNIIYRKYPQFWANDTSWNGYKWLICNDKSRSILAFMRMNDNKKIICIFNFTPIVYKNYELPVDEEIKALLILSSDDPQFGGKGELNNSLVLSHKIDDRIYISINVPAYGGLYFMVMPKY